MENLMKKYNSECDITSKLADKIWRMGNIIVLVGIFYFTISGNIIIALLTEVIGIIFLYILCEYFNIKKIKNKLRLKKIILINNKDYKSVYYELDSFQKKWITNYCKKNKLNTIEKLNIVREELKQRKEDSIIDYINPPIVGNLLILIWEFFAKNIAESDGIVNSIVPVILLTFLLSLIAVNIKKQRQFMNIFRKFSRYERLDKLLLYRILKTSK